MFLDRKVSAEDTGVHTAPPSPPDLSWLHDDEAKTHGPGFWAGMMLLVATIAGLSFVTYSFVSEHKSMLHQFAALPQFISTLGERVTKTEDSLRQWAGEQQGIRDRLSALQAGWDAKFRTARRQAQQSTEELINRAKTEAEDRASKIDTRITQVQTAQESDQAKLARLENEVTEMRQRVATHDSQIAAGERNNRTERDGLQQRLSGMDQQIAGNQADTGRLAREAAARRVDFQLAKNRYQQLTPGITVRLTGTDVTHQRVKGWIDTSTDHQTAIRFDQPVQQPVVLYTADGQRRDLVFTRVGKNTSAGYVLIPGGSATGGD